MSQEQKHGKHNEGYQRAAILGLMCNILTTKEPEISIQQVRMSIVQVLSDLIDSGHMVGDIIDMHVAVCCHNYIEELQQEQAVKSALDIIKESKV